MTGGHIFNYIETPQFVGQDHEGGFVFFARSMSYQFQSEAFIITIICKFFSRSIMDRIQLYDKLEGASDFSGYRKGPAHVPVWLGGLL